MRLEVSRSLLSRLTGEAPHISTGFTSAPPSLSEPPWVGSETTGTLSAGVCPSRYFAAGIIGSTAYSNYVGNFGIVCVPYNKSIGIRELDRAQVIAGGSVGTHFGKKTEDLNTYYNDFYSKESAVYTGVNVFKSQNVQMCRPGYGLEGLFVTVGNAGRIQRIEGMFCRPFLKGLEWLINGYFQSTISILEENIGGLGTPPGTALWLRCGENNMVTGLRIRSGWETDGLGFICAQY